MRTCARCTSTSWSHFRHCRSISSGYFCTILIHTFHSDWCWCTNILFLWSKGDRTIWVNCVYPYSLNSLFRLTVFEGHWTIHVNRNSRVAWTESWLATLRLTLKAGWFSIGAGRRYPCYRWRIGSSHFCSVFIYTLNSNWSWGTHILFVWGKGDSTIWVDGIFPYSLNRLLRLTIFKGHWRIRINRNKWITTLEAWVTCLRNTLRTCACRIGASWNHFFHHCLVFDCNRSAIGIGASQFKFRCLTLKLLVWREGHFTICIYFKLTDIRYFFHCWIIIKQWCWIRWERNRVVPWGEGHFTFLNLTLQAFCLVSNTSWLYSRYCCLIFCLRKGTVDICATDFNFWRFTYECLNRCKGNITINIHFKLANILNFFHIGTSVKNWGTVYWKANFWSSCFKSNLTILNQSLWTFSPIASCVWNNFFNSRSVSSCHFGSIRIYTFDRHWGRLASKFLLRLKGNGTIWINGISSLISYY